MTNKRIFNIILSIPIINSIADVTTNYFPPGQLNPGSIRALFLFTFLMYLIVFKNIIRYTPKVILMFLLYILILSFLSSNIHLSLFVGWLKLFIIMMMYSLGYRYVDNIDNFKKLIIAMALSAIIINISIVISQIYRLGSSAYVEDTFYTGGAAVQISTQLAIILLLLPEHIKHTKSKIKKILFYMVLVISIAIIILIFRRTAIFVIFVGWTIYFTLSHKKYFYLKYIILFIPVYSILSTLF